MASRNQKQIIKAQPVDITRYQGEEVGGINPIDTTDAGLDSILAKDATLTSGSQKTQLYYSDGITAVDIQNPLPIDGDSIYAKDINLIHSTKVGWTGNIIDLFGCPSDSVGMYNDSVTNPKIIYIAFCRVVYLNAIGLGCNLAGKTFSNVKFEFIGSDGTVRYTYDDSANNTQRGTYLYSIPLTLTMPAITCIGVKISL